MNAGSLRFRVDFYQDQPLVGSFNAGGQTLVPLKVFSGVPADIEATRSGDRASSGQLVSETEVMITIRYMDGVHADMQVKWTPSFPGRRLPTQTYVILGIVPGDGKDRFASMKLTCRAIGDNQ